MNWEAVEKKLHKQSEDCKAMMETTPPEATASLAALGTACIVLVGLAAAIREARKS